MCDQGKRVALVTGRNRGIGLEIGRQLAVLGYRVVLTGRDGGRADEAARTLDRWGSGDVELYGAVDVLVNHAGIALDGPERRTSAPDLAKVHRTLETNLFGAWRCAREAVPPLRQRGYGRIVNVSSTMASLELTTSPSSPACRISKAGLNMLTQLLAADLQYDGILVDAASPGHTRTDIARMRSAKSSRARTHPSGWRRFPTTGPPVASSTSANGSCGKSQLTVDNLKSAILGSHSRPTQREVSAFMSATQFRPKYVSFDCYGTLIDFQITPITRELVGDQVPAGQWDRFVKQFRGYRYDQVRGEYYAYEQVLQDSFERVCRRWGLEADPNAGKRFAEGVRSWGPHADVLAPLKHMGEHYKLVILSNADDSFLAESVPRLEVDFHAVYTAEQAGYYKPRYAAFEYMLDQLDASPEDFVHVSSHTRYDLMPMHDMGFRNLALLDRGYDPVTPGYDYVTVKSLDELNTMLGI